MKSQSPLFRQKFNYYKQYARADIDKFFSEKELVGVKKWIVNYDKSAYIENLGNGKFSFHSLPIEAQFAPVYDFEITDLNNDNINEETESNSVETGTSEAHEVSEEIKTI